MSEASVESRWWLWIAAMPFVTVVEALFAFLLIGFASQTAGGLSPTTLLAAGSPFLAIAVIVRVGLPIALYRDAQAMNEAGLVWKPDPANWGFLGFGLIFVPILDTILAVVYLRRRSHAVGSESSESATES